MQQQASPGQAEQAVARLQQRQQLLLCLSMLRHLAYKSSGAKLALTKAGAMDTALRLWTQASAHPSTMHELLLLLANMLPSCPAAIAQLSGGGQTLLLQNLLGLLLAGATEAPTFEAVVRLLGSLAATEEGAAALARSGLLGRAQQQMWGWLRGKEVGRQAGLLQVLAAVAAWPEGRRAMLREAESAALFDLVVAVLAAQLADSTEQQLAVAVDSQPPCQQAMWQALLLLRNLAFCADCRQLVLANGQALGLLVRAAEGAEHDAVAAALASSCLWALAYQGEQLKAGIRRVPGAMNRLVVARAQADYSAGRLAAAGDLGAAGGEVVEVQQGGAGGVVGVAVDGGGAQHGWWLRQVEGSLACLVELMDSS